jgi:signal transduction histidine kinase
LQARRFVDPAQGGAATWRGAAPAEAMLALVDRILGPGAAQNLRRQHPQASPGMLMHEAEMALAGAMGAASARGMVRSVLQQESLAADDMLAILDESAQAIAHSRELEQKSLELERASTELRAANQRLTELDRMKDDFLSTVTHELRTPLTSIRAFSEILRDHPDLPAQKRSAYLDIIIRESERLTRLINDVLDLAKLDAGRAEWHAETLDLAQVVRDALEASGQLLRDKAIALEVHLPPATPPVRADRDRLMQVMLNLLSNAAKFCSAPDGRIAVSLQREANALQVAVSDNGPGVRPEDREIIFDKFRQGGDNLTGKPQGTGLGLPISRRIVSHFGGRLWLEDAPGGGARFLFTLPLESTLETAPASPLESQP